MIENKEKEEVSMYKNSFIDVDIVASMDRNLSNNCIIYKDVSGLICSHLNVLFSDPIPTNDDIVTCIFNKNNLSSLSSFKTLSVNEHSQFILEMQNLLSFINVWINQKTRKIVCHPFSVRLASTS